MPMLTRDGFRLNGGGFNGYIKLQEISVLSYAILSARTCLRNGYIVAIIVLPASTRSPRFACIRNPVILGMKISAREPKRIIPTMAPAVILSPGSGSKMTRRAIAPDICFMKTASCAAVSIRISLRWFRLPQWRDIALPARPGMKFLATTWPVTGARVT